MSKEIKLSAIRPIVSRTDLKGKIKYANSYFIEVSGYSEKELIGTPHNIIRHPDMPKIIFKIMWQRLDNNQNILAIVKNQTKTGDYYWVTTLFETKYNHFDNTPEAYLALRKAVPKKALETIEPLYKELIAQELLGGVKASEAYLLEILRDKDMTYDEFMQDIVEYNGLVAKFFNSMKKLFI